FIDSRESRRHGITNRVVGPRDNARRPSQCGPTLLPDVEKPCLPVQSNQDAQMKSDARSGTAQVRAQVSRSPGSLRRSLPRKVIRIEKGYERDSLPHRFELASHFEGHPPPK